MTTVSLVLQSWRFCPERDTCSTVLPDGCRDLILRRAPGGEPLWFISSLADQAYPVDCLAGEAFAGHRLLPGTRLPEAELLAALGTVEDAAAALPLIAACGTLEASLEEALAGLAESPSVARARTWLGVSERSLERLVSTGTGRPPGYWLRLARVRRLARALSAGSGADAVALVDLAAALGYADQAHMNRECRRWFGLAPGALRRQPELLALAAEPGYG